MIRGVIMTERIFVLANGSAKAHHIIRFEGLLDGENVLTSPLLIVKTKEVREFYNWFKGLTKKEIFC